MKYKELLLFHKDGGRLRNVSDKADRSSHKVFAARGMAIGDYDNNGRVDVLIGNNGGAPVLLRNRAGAANHWLGVKLEATRCNRDAIGARIRWSAGGVTHSHSENGGGSYLSAHGPRAVLRLGATEKSDWLEVRWPRPSVRTGRFTNLPPDRYLTIAKAKASTKAVNSRPGKYRMAAIACTVIRHKCGPYSEN